MMSRQRGRMLRADDADLADERGVRIRFFRGKEAGDCREGAEMEKGFHGASQGLRVLCQAEVSGWSSAATG